MCGKGQYIKQWLERNSKNNKLALPDADPFNST